MTIADHFLFLTRQLHHVTMRRPFCQGQNGRRERAVPQSEMEEDLVYDWPSTSAKTWAQSCGYKGAGDHLWRRQRRNNGHAARAQHW